MVLMIHYLDIWDTQITQWSLSNLKVHIFQNWCIIYIYTYVFSYAYMICIYIYYILYICMSVYMLSGSRMLNWTCWRWERSFFFNFGPVAASKTCLKLDSEQKAARRVMWMPHVDLTMKIIQAGHQAPPLALEIAAPMCPASWDFDHILGR